MSERVQKLLAAAGLGSRRALERVIAEGGVSINGRVATLGDRIEGGDQVDINRRRYLAQTFDNVQARVLAYHKPEGEVCTRSDEKGRATVFDNLPKGRGRWITIGRLDINTSGLLLLTDDGELAHRLMHPSTGIERRYAVRVFGDVDEAIPARLLQGVELDDGPARFQSIEDAGGRGANHWYHVALSEGRNHEVKRLWESQGVTVSRLIRIAYGPIQLDPRLRLGQARPLTADELRSLQAAAGLDAAPAAQLVLREQQPKRRPPRRRR